MGKHRTGPVAVAIDADGMPTDTFMGRIISAEWPGGAYVNLSFGGHTKPVEVINVYNHASGTVDPRVHKLSTLSDIVREWATDSAREWPEYYSDYLANV